MDLQQAVGAIDEEAGYADFREALNILGRPPLRIDLAER